MNEVKEIEFVFENCEYFKISRDAIGEFLIDGITTTISRLAVNSIAKTQRASEIMIEIFSEGNGEYDSFGVDKENKFKRIINYHDIASLIITYEDGTEDRFLVDYDEGKNEGVLGAENINEDVYLSKPGNLYIVISASRKKIKDYFGMKYVNDSEKIKTAKQIYT